jgi:hypothetical protein
VEHSLALQALVAALAELKCEALCRAAVVVEEKR